MDLQDRAIHRFRRQLATLFVLKFTLPLATVYAFVWGTVVLALRASLQVERRPLLWGLTGLTACLAVAIVRARRRLPSASAIRALLDEQSGCGGLLMAGAEQDLGGWRQRLPVLTPPRVSWDGRRSATLLALAVGFVLLCFLVPQSFADLETSDPLEIDQEIGRLLKQIALLKVEAILDPKRAEMLAEKLAELRDHSSGKDPSRTLEALDHVRGLTRDAARQAAEQNTQRSQHLGEAQALAEALLQNADLLDPQLVKQVMAEMEGMMSKDAMPPELMRVLRQQKLDPKEMEKLMGMLRGQRGELMKRMEKLQRMGLIDADALTRCRDIGEFDLEGLRDFLKDKDGKVSLEDFKSHWLGCNSDSRGPGAAPLTWKKSGSEDGFRFKEEMLPPGALDALKSTPIQEARGAGVIHKKSTETASSGALQGAAAGNGSANTEVILPRHRSSVERYFERKSK